ncbi:putative cytosolic protein [Borrelia duttonii CR2A]|uniref:Putative cytosolic protein n=1 Tax=Borrelia duttonii CR2A TaxID=1432657 RepID=W6U173_9SPIR|nr:putative cytosolic protein [Borrelia duttonii CR2A]
MFVQFQVYSARFFIMNYLEAKLGFKIKYNKIDPYFLSSIKIDNLELSLNEQDKVLMHTVKVNLDLFNLLLGNENIILDIFVKGSTLNFDLNDFKILKSKSSIPMKLELNDEKASRVIIGKMFDSFESLHMHLEDININLKLGSGRFLRFQINNFILKTIDDDFLFNFVVNFGLPEVLYPDVNSENIVNSVFYFEGKFKKDLEDGYINFSFLEFYTDYLLFLNKGFK